MCFLPFPRPDVCAHEVVTLNIHRDDVSGSPGRHQRPAAVGGPRFPLLSSGLHAPALERRTEAGLAAEMDQCVRTDWICNAIMRRRNLCLSLSRVHFSLSHQRNNQKHHKTAIIIWHFPFSLFFYLKHSHLFDSFFLSRTHTRLC